MCIRDKNNSRETDRRKKPFKIDFELLSYHIMLIPGVILLFIFSTIPLFGLIIAFQNYVPAKGIPGSKWVGLSNFIYMFQLPDSRQIFFNTIIIAVCKIIAGIVIPVIFALLLNEIRNRPFKRCVQTIVSVSYTHLL